MQALAEHILRPILKHPDDLRLQVIEGEAAILLEAIVHAEDRAALEDEDARTLRSVRTILSAAAGRMKATLDLVDDFSPPSVDGGEE
jgi:predicted RNA-binding protein YlqC (UPF0109 family)